MSGAKTREKFNACEIEFTRSKIFCNNPLLT